MWSDFMEKDLTRKRNVSFLLNCLIKQYGLSYEEAYTWLLKSKTYSIVMDIDGLFYYAGENTLKDLLQCEYEGRISDWKNKIIAY